MAIKKSELYSSIWQRCDELRGGMDASEYKVYVLIMLFIKYISDKYAGVPYAPITVPSGASFSDMVALKGETTIGDDIKKKIIGPIEDANKSLGSIKVDFDNPEKLGTGKEKVEQLNRHSLPTLLCFNFFLTAQNILKFFANAQKAHLLLPDTHSNASQNQKSHYLASTSSIITIFTLLKI